MRVVALVLAAGPSRRMAPAHKLLEPFGARTVLGTALARLDASTVEDIVVLVGHDGARVAAVAATSSARALVCPASRYEHGLSATLAAGLAQVPAEAAGVLICLADMPLVRTETIEQLLAAFRSSTGARPILAPVHHGRRGNPVLWHRAHLPALAGLAEEGGGDEGGRALLGRHQADLVLVETDDPGVLIDVDTPEALRRARASLPAMS